MALRLRCGFGGVAFARIGEVLGISACPVASLGSRKRLASGEPTATIATVTAIAAAGSSPARQRTVEARGACRSRGVPWRGASSRRWPKAHDRAGSSSTVAHASIPSRQTRVLGARVALSRAAHNSAVERTTSASPSATHHDASGVVSRRASTNAVSEAHACTVS